MDPSEPGERCLPEMGLSGWMKRTMERSYDLSDFCNSPPVDGFYYPNLQQQKGNNAGVAGKGNCSADLNNRKEETRNCTVMGSVLSISQPQPMITQHLSHAIGSNPSLYQATSINNVGGGSCNAITTGETVPEYLKPVVSGFASSAFSKQLSLGLSHHQNLTDSPTGSDDGKDPQASPDEMHTWSNTVVDDVYCSNEHIHGDVIQSHPSDDSAPTPVDHIVSSRYTPTIQIVAQEDDGGSSRLVHKLGARAGNRSYPATPDVTPCTTPAITPTCSPQVARRTGNPFFTGGTDDNNTTSWLFRPGKKAGDGKLLQPDQLYEAKIEFQQQPNSKIAKKTVRYVPRPSELRELNFWSPTSM